MFLMYKIQVHQKGTPKCIKPPPLGMTVLRNRSTEREKAKTLSGVCTPTTQQIRS